MGFLISYHNIDIFSTSGKVGGFFPPTQNPPHSAGASALGRQLSQLQSVSGVTVKLHEMDEKIIETVVKCIIHGNL